MRAFAIACLVAVLAWPLGGCVTAQRDPVVVSNAALQRTGNWRIERQADRITGKAVSSAFLHARASHSRAPYPLDSVLQVRCLKDEPVIHLQFLIKVGSTRNSEFGYRFDKKPGREADARFLQDSKSVVIEDQREVAHFLNEMRTSEALYIRIMSLNAGRTAVEFRLEGASAAIERALDGCLPAKLRARTAAR